ncbi:lipopolysaccharide heptosyltransferase II [Deferribacteres bacterium DY0037]
MKILFFNPSFMGDSILTTPLIKAVKQHRPESYIVFCVRPENADLFKNLDFIDEVITFDKRGSESGIRGLYSFAQKIRQMNFDMVFSPHMSFRTSAFMFLSHIPERVGFVESVLSTAYTMSCAKDLTYHEVDRYLLLFQRVFGEFPPDIIMPEVYLDKKKAAQYRSELKGKLVGINAGSVWETKKWPAEKFAAVADMLKDRGFTPVIIGAESDRADVEKLLASAKHDHINYCGKTTLKELPALISNFAYLVTNDSGSMHIATACDVPCVAIFGPTVKELGFYPYDEKSLIAEIEGLPCRPCGKHGGNKCPKGHFKCMNEITPENVMTLFDDVSAEEEPPRTPKYKTETVG